MSSNNGKAFRDDEMFVLSHYDGKEGRWVETEYPRIGGRLRLAHEDNEQLTITTEIIRYDENIAVVRAVVETRKGSFSGMGMASAERDKTIAPAILELAETRSIARCLRFAGFGMEYCGAEEVSHLSGNGQQEPPAGEKPNQQRQNGGNGNGSGNGSGAGRITNRQLNYLINLGKGLGLDSKDLDQETVSAYGVKMAHLNVKDASAFIETLKSREVPF